MSDKLPKKSSTERRVIDKSWRKDATLTQQIKQTPPPPAPPKK
ncbi:hypothetical protein [Alicyclobacillus macrosporangiidus]|nr:hypothetical protein [Alicyclobacillus macrosporangiidus]